MARFLIPIYVVVEAETQEDAWSEVITNHVAALWAAEIETDAVGEPEAVEDKS